MMSLYFLSKSSRFYFTFINMFSSPLQQRKCQQLELKLIYSSKQLEKTSVDICFPNTNKGDDKNKEWKGGGEGEKNGYYFRART